MKKSQILIFLNEQLELGARLSSESAFKKLKEEYPKFNKTIRTVSRYLNELEENHTIIKSRLVDSKKIYFIKNVVKTSSKTKHYFKDNYIISLKVLESQLEMFKSSKISKDIQKLIDIIQKETGFNTNSFNSDSIFHNHVLGTYDYSSLKHGKIIDEILSAMESSKYVEVSYQTDDKLKKITGAFQEIYFYGGALYAAFYVKKHNHNISLALHFIYKIKVLDDTHNLIFDFEDFSKTRFGVHEGEPERIVLQINPDYRRHFVNRTFHSSQDLIFDGNNIILTMDVPITPELLSWVIGWGEGLKVKSPNKLKLEIIEQLKATINMYD